MTTRLLNAGRKLQARVRDFFDASPDATAPPLELLQAALDQLERKVQPSGRGTRCFPYDRVIVHIAQSEVDRTAIDAVFADLPARLRERLTELRCELPMSFEACAAFDTPSDDGPVLWVECTRSAPADAPADTVAPAGTVVSAIAATAATDANADILTTPAGHELLPQLRVSVLAGQCEQTAYTLAERVITIGRGASPTDTLGRMRRNQIVFRDEIRDGVTETVARAHARLEFDPALQAYLLFNESSSNPTFIRRGGRNLRVAPRDPRGVRVEAGDELQLGRAVLRLV